MLRSSSESGTSKVENDRKCAGAGTVLAVSGILRIQYSHGMDRR